MTDNPDISQLISELSNPNERDRHAASNALKLIGQAAVEPLIAVLQTGNESARNEAILALRYINDVRAVPAFLKTIQDDPVLNVQLQSLSSIYVFIDAPGVVEAIIRLAQDDSQPQKRRAAVHLLATHKKMEGDYWLEMLSDSDEWVVISAIRVLAKANDPRTPDALRNILGKWAANDGVTFNIFNSWLALIPKPTVEDFAPYLTSPDGITRGRAAWILGKVGDGRAIDLLKPLLEDKVQVFREDNYAPYETVGSLAKKAIDLIQKAKP